MLRIEQAPMLHLQNSTGVAALSLMTARHCQALTFFSETHFLINCSHDQKCENTWTKQQQQKTLTTKPNTEIPTGNLRNAEPRKDSGQESSKRRETPLRIIHPSLLLHSPAASRSSSPSMTAQTRQFQSPLASAYILFATSSSQLLHWRAALPVTQGKGEQPAKMPAAHPPCLVGPGSPQSKSCQLGNVLLMLHAMLINSHQGGEGFLNTHVWEVMLALPSHSFLKLPSWDWGFKDQWGKAKVKISSLLFLLELSQFSSSSETLLL